MLSARCRGPGSGASLPRMGQMLAVPLIACHALVKPTPIPISHIILSSNSSKDPTRIPFSPGDECQRSQSRAPHHTTWRPQASDDATATDCPRQVARVGPRLRSPGSCCCQLKPPFLCKVTGVRRFSGMEAGKSPLECIYVTEFVTAGVRFSGVMKATPETFVVREVDEEGNVPATNYCPHHSRRARCSTGKPPYVNARPRSGHEVDRAAPRPSLLVLQERQPQRPCRTGGRRRRCL
jgi:hypothetical protein